MSQAERMNITSAAPPETRSAPMVSRRALIGGAGALALASPTSAETRDPVFALIEAQRDARRRFDAAGDAKDALIESLPYDVTRPAIVQVGRMKRGEDTFDPIYAYTHDDIRAERGWAHCLPRKKRAAFRRILREWKRAKHAALREDEERLARLQAEAGLTEARRLEKIADDEEARALDALLAATPTTIEGALAVATYLREYDRKFLNDFDELDPGYRTAAVLERTLAAMMTS